MRANRPVFIVGGKRVPFVKSMTKFLDVTTQELMVASLKALVEDFNLKGKIVGDVGLGSVMLSSSSWNLARESVLSSGLSPSTPGYNLQRACGTSLEATWQLALKIAHFQIDDAIAGGVDTNSDLPIEVSRTLKAALVKASAEKSLLRRMSLFLGVGLKGLKPITPAVVEPRTGLSMGQHTEKMVKDWGITREAQDTWAYESHQKASKAYEEGFFKDLVVDFHGVQRDGTVRRDTTIEKLSLLKPVFDKKAGTLTAGNSSPLTDGSSAVLLASEDSIKRNHWTPWSRFIDAQVAAVDFVGGEGLLMAPTKVVSVLLERNRLSLQDFDFYEIHEAFAGQVLCTLKAWESEDYCRRYLGRSKAWGSIERTKINIKGSSLAVGHPFAATGTRIVATLSKVLAQNRGRGLISICTAGGMGIAAILESP